MYIYVDTETITPLNPNFKKIGHVAIGLWTALWIDKNNNECKKQGLNETDLMEFLINKSKRQSISVGMHNLKFDLSYLTKYILENFTPNYNTNKLKENEFKETTGVRCGVINAQIKTGKYYLKFFDTNKLIPEKVETLGKWLNMPKLMDIDIHSLPLVNNIKDMPEVWLKRNEIDTRIIMLIHQKMLELGFKGNTIGSAVLKDFKNKIGRHLYERIYDNVFTTYDEWKIPKSTYNGGLVLYNNEEINKWQTFENYGIAMDINSSYPNQAVNSPNIKGKPTHIKINNGVEMIKVKIYEFKLKKNKIAWFSLRNSFNGEVKYIKEGKLIIKWLWKKEFEALLNDYDMDYEILERIWYKTNDKLTQWFKEKFELRNKFKKENNDVMEKLLKLAMNSLTGKFGQSPICLQKKWKMLVSEEFFNNLPKNELIIYDEQQYCYQHLDKEDHEKYCKLNHRIIYYHEKYCNKQHHKSLVEINGYHHCPTPVDTKRYNNVAVISNITSNARIHLMNVINNNDNPKYFKYADTDSIIFSHANKIEMPNNIYGQIGDELGHWKIEHTKITDFIVLRKKGYRFKGFSEKKQLFETKTVLSGLNKKNSKMIKDEDFRIGYVKKNSKIISKTTKWGNELIETDFKIKEK